jgi:hypothetical protein
VKYAGFDTQFAGDVKSGTGSGLAVTVSVMLTAHPMAFLTVTVTGYLPGALY